MTIASGKQLHLENGQTHTVRVVETNGEWLCFEISLDQEASVTLETVTSEIKQHITLDTS